MIDFEAATNMKRAALFALSPLAGEGWGEGE
jgi:hypothetical protein